MRCPNCGNELDEDNYCDECFEFFNDSVDSSQDFDEEPDYDSMVNNGQEICLNCTYWSVSPYGAAHGMYCRRGNGQTEPDDTCFDFVQSHKFANYGYEGQFQFNETDRDISNKLYYWKNSRY
ncbi:MAG: hypothetical protein Q4Q18_09165 [Methanobrevibacter sp.]|nr:hypothetical protein [Methanobrevibacter sp.]